MHKLPAVFVGLLLATSSLLADTLTFFAQFDPGSGSTNNSWFSVDNWFVVDDTGNWISAGRVPLANETAVVTGTVDAGISGIRLQTLVLTNGASVLGGTFSLERLQMLSSSTFQGAKLNVLTLMSLTGADCTLSASTLTVLGNASGTIGSVPPAAPATVKLSQASALVLSGYVTMTDGSEIQTGDGAQSRIVISGTLASKDSAAVRGTDATNPLIIDNGGIIHADAGTLTFSGPIDWRSSAGVAQFEAVATNALIMFASPLQVPSGVTTYFKGTGTGRLQAGGTIDGLFNIETIGTNTASFSTGQVVIDDSIDGSGNLIGAGNGTSGAVVLWNSGTLSFSTMTIQAGAELVLSNVQGTNRILSRCVVNNSGLCTMRGGQLTFADGARFENLSDGMFLLEGDGVFAGAPLPDGGALNNSGTFLKTSAGESFVGTTTPPEGPDFNNTGLLEIQKGALSLFAGTSSGDFRVATNAALKFWGGTHVLTPGAVFSGFGPVRVLQGAAPAALSVQTNLAMEALELGRNGTLNGPTNGSSVSIFDLVLSENALLTNSAAIIGHALTVVGPDCTMSNSVLTVQSNAHAVIGAAGTGALAGLTLASGSVLNSEGEILLFNQGFLRGLALPQSRVRLQPGGILSTTNSGVIRGELMVDNSGVIRAQSGMLVMQDTLDWQSSFRSGDFQATSSNSVLLFSSPFKVPAGVASRFSGPGTARLAAGGVIDGRMDVGLFDLGFSPGFVELFGTLSGDGTARVLGAEPVGSVIRWPGGVLNVRTVEINADARMILPGLGATNREIARTTINNAGTIQWQGGDLKAGSGAAINVSPGGLLELLTDVAIESNQLDPVMAIRNSGRVLKSGGTGQTIIAADVFNSGVLQVDTGVLQVDGALVQTQGSTAINTGAVLAAPLFQVQSGEVSGGGIIRARVENQGAFLPAGTLRIDAGMNFQQLDKGTVTAGLRNADPAQNDLLVVAGTAQLGGKLDIALKDGFVPQPGQHYAVLTSGTISGTFGSINGPTPSSYVWVPQYTSTNVTVSLAKQAPIGSPQLVSRTFSVSIPTSGGVSYAVQACTNLNFSHWETIQVITGDGTLRTISEPATQPQRYYRVLEE